MYIHEIDYGVGNCDVCGAAYKAKAKMQRYCGIECRQKNNAKMRKGYRMKAIEGEIKCKGCEVNFVRTNRSQLYCTTKCRKSINNKNFLKKKPRKRVWKKQEPKPLIEVFYFVPAEKTELAGCKRCKKLWGHDDWCPIGGSDAN